MKKNLGFTLNLTISNDSKGDTVQSVVFFACENFPEKIWSSIVIHENWMMTGVPPWIGVSPCHGPSGPAPAWETPDESNSLGDFMIKNQPSNEEFTVSWMGNSTGIFVSQPIFYDGYFNGIFTEVGI